MPLESLPSESVLDIIHQVNHARYDNERLRGLSALSRSNRHFHTLVQPILYERIEHVYGIKSIYLLRTLSTTPKLAAMVKTINLYLECFAPQKFDPHTREAYEIIQAKLASFDTRFFHELSKYLGTLSQNEALLPILLSLTPNVEPLKLLEVHDTTIFSWRDMLRHEVSHSFAHLQVVEINIQTRPDFASLRPLFALPTLRKMHLSYYTDGLAEFRRPLPLLPRENSNLETLTLRKSLLTTSRLAEVLGAFDQLQHFLYSHAEGLGFYDSAPDLNFAAIASALSGTENTLQTLGVFAPISTVNPDNSGVGASFCDFPYLKKILLPFWAFEVYERDIDEYQLVNSLPESLEHLTINTAVDPDSSLTNIHQNQLLAMTRLAIEGPKYFPFLKHVWLVIQGKWQHGPWMSELGDHFTANGIAFEVVWLRECSDMKLRLSGSEKRYFRQLKFWGNLVERWEKARVELIDLKSKRTA